MDFSVKTLTELSSEELLEIIKQRVKVFVVEQQCPYQEVDEADKNALHLMFTEQDKIVAYTRIIDKIDYVSFGRVLVVQEYRGRHLGRRIVNQTIEEIKNKFPGKYIKISGQEYLQAFYESFGFKAVSVVYLEDGLPHLDMILEG